MPVAVADEVLARKNASSSSAFGMFGSTYKLHGHTTAALGQEGDNVVDSQAAILIDFFNVSVVSYTPNPADEASRAQVLKILDGTDEHSPDSIDGRISLGHAALEVFESVEALNSLAWSHLQQAHTCQLLGRSFHIPKCTDKHFNVPT